MYDNIHLDLHIMKDTPMCIKHKSVSYQSFVLRIFGSGVNIVSKFLILNK